MASTNSEVAALLREYAELLGIVGGDQFRVRNYERAARSVAGYPEDLSALPDRGLTAIPGVGSSIAAKIAECRRTGSFAALDELRARVPPGARELAKVPGVGQKRAVQLARELNVTSVSDLDHAVRSGRLRGVAGFGPKTEERILRGIAVAASDAALRDGLRALPPHATEDDIRSVLAAHVAITATGAKRGAPRSAGVPRSAGAPRSAVLATPRPGRQRGPAKRSTISFRGKALSGLVTCAVTCTRIPTSPTASSPWRE